MIAQKNNEYADTEKLSSLSQHSLLRRFSITSLVAMIVTASILVFMYWQSELIEHKELAAEEDKEYVTHFVQMYADRIHAYVVSTEGLDVQALRANQNLEIITAALESFPLEHNRLKLKIFNLSGTTIYSSVKDEIGGSSTRPDLLKKVISGETAHIYEFRDTFFSAIGEMHNIYISSTYLPLTHAGKQIGVIEVYTDSTPLINSLKVKNIQIVAMVFCAFAMLYAVLFIHVRRADCAVAERQERLAEQEAFFRMIAENVDDFIAVLDLKGRRLYNSPSYASLFGSVEAIKGTDSFAEIHPDDRERIKQIFKETVQSGIGHRTEYRFVLADGSIRHMESCGGLIKNSQGQALRVAVVSHDITERKKAEEEIHNLAFHDALTKLPNRRLLNDRLVQTMAASKRSGLYCALLFMDMDNFKPLNDAYGHEVGDSLLMEVARRITSCVREVDTVARFGGDEFVVVLNELGEDKAESTAQAGIIAEKIRTILAEPYVLKVQHDGKAETTIDHHSTSSIGVVLFINHEASAEDILKWADISMYQAKDAGRNQIQFYDAKA